MCTHMCECVRCVAGISSHAEGHCVRPICRLDNIEYPVEALIGLPSHISVVRQELQLNKMACPWI